MKSLIKSFLSILRENKDNIIDKTDWPQEQKDEAKKFFNTHPEQEGKLGSKWNNPKSLSFLNDIQPIIDDFNNRESKSRTKKEIKNKVKKTKDLGDYFRARNGKNNFEFDIMYSDDEFVLGFPLTWETCVYLDSFEDFGVGAEWCIGAKEDSRHWDSYTENGDCFLFLFSKYDTDAISMADSGEDYKSNYRYKQHTNLKYMIQFYGGCFVIWNAEDRVIFEESSISALNLRQSIFNICLGITKEISPGSELWVKSVENRLTPQLFEKIEEVIPEYPEELIEKARGNNYSNLNRLENEKIKEFIEKPINLNKHTQEILESLGEQLQEYWRDIIDFFPGNAFYWEDEVEYFVEKILNDFREKYESQSEGFTQEDMLKLNAVQSFCDYNDIGKIPFYGSISRFIAQLEQEDERMAGQQLLFDEMLNEIDENTKKVFKNILNETLASSCTANFTPENTLGGVQSAFGSPIARKKHPSGVIYAKDTITNNEKALFESILKTEYTKNSVEKYSEKSIDKFLNESKEKLIDRLDDNLISKEKKEIVKDFFKRHPNLEGGIDDFKINWNSKDLTFETDFEPLINWVENKQLSSAFKRHPTCKVIYEDDENIFVVPTTHEDCVFFDSRSLFNRPAKWCIGQKDENKHFNWHFGNKEIMFLWYNTKVGYKYMLMYSPSITSEGDSPGYYLWDDEDHTVMGGENGKKGLSQLVNEINIIISTYTVEVKKRFSEQEIYRLFRKAKKIIENEMDVPMVVNFSFGIGNDSESVKIDFEEAMDGYSEEELEKLKEECREYEEDIQDIYDIPNLQINMASSFLNEMMSREGREFYFFDRLLLVEWEGNFNLTVKGKAIINKGQLDHFASMGEEVDSDSLVIRSYDDHNYIFGINKEWPIYPREMFLELKGGHVRAAMGNEPEWRDRKITNYKKDMGKITRL
jgi:hypothetical protein